MTWEQWTSRAQSRRIWNFETQARCKKTGGRSARIAVSPAADPYQSDEAAQPNAKAVLILEQYHLRVQIATLCGLRSVR